MGTWKVLGIVIALIIILFGILLLFPIENNPPESSGYLKINNETQVCEYYYICFLRNGIWHRPSYNAGVNLILANDIKIENESQIKQIFGGEKINIVMNTTEYGSSENSELIIDIAPFSHYLSYYYNTIRKQDKQINVDYLSQYNSTEPAIMIFGPGLGATEDSIEFDGKSIIVQGQSSEGLSLMLGKLLLVMVS